MKTRLLIITLILLLIPNLSFAIEGAISSGEQTADAQIATGNGFLTAVQVITDGTNDAKIIIYDNTAASGKVLNEFTINGGSHFGGREPLFPPEFHNGLRVDVSGTGASYILEYIPR